MDLTLVGGKPFHSDLAFADPHIDNECWDFGFIREEARSASEKHIVEDSISEIPDLKIQGTTKYASDKVCIYDCWKHPIVSKANGFEYPGNHQLTGSCVGAGGGNAIFSVAAADAVIRGEAETPLIPFWLIPYGRSRFYLGYRTRGEGSTGTTFAKAVQDDGCPPASTEGLPSFTHSDGLVWGSSVELQWSDGDSIPEKWLLLAKKNLVKSAAVCKSIDDVRAAINNYYAVTIASNWGGQMQCQVVEGVLLNKRVTTWSHQMSIHAWWVHPKLGELYWIQNNWGLDAHGRDPSGGPPGGFWVHAAEIEWILRSDGEVFAFSQWDGFPAQEISWYI